MPTVGQGVGLKHLNPSSISGSASRHTSLASRSPCLMRLLRPSIAVDPGPPRAHFQIDRGNATRSAASTYNSTAMLVAIIVLAPVKSCRAQRLKT